MEVISFMRRCLALAAVMLCVLLFSFPSAAKPKVDFTGDGIADVFLRNAFTGEVSAWLVSPGGVAGVSYGSVSIATGWTPLAFGDFNGDKRTDVLWYNVNDGSFTAWLMNGASVQQYVSYGSVPTTSGWVPIGTGDFNGDGATDLFWYNRLDGSTSAWLINGSGIAGSTSYGAVPPSTAWIPIGFGDFNGDSRTDLLWYNTTTGAISGWLLDGFSLLQATDYGSVAFNSGWQPVGVGDFNADGRSDLIWYHAVSGDISAWLINGAVVEHVTAYGAVAPDSGWRPAAVGEFNGDGRSDLFWYHALSGATSSWLISGGQVLQYTSYGSNAPQLGWVPVGLDDFNGDGRSDLLWRNGFDNTSIVWLLDGPALVQQVSFPNVPQSSLWQLHIPR